MMPTLDNLPPEFCADTLRRRYADLAPFDDAEMRVHFETFGRAEGRVAAEASLRENLIGLIDPTLKILEVGPFCQPIFTGPSVRYLDVLDAEGLARRAAEIGMDASRCPAEIHYTTGMAAAAGENFDIIFSSHNLEHQPDLIGHLNQAAEALSKTGLYVMLVPDKRYCFDHFLPETTVADVVEAHQERRTVHAIRNVIEHVALTCHNDSLLHWKGDHGVRPDGTDGRISLATDRLSQADGAYIDVHAWKLTPAILREILMVLTTHLGLLNLEAARIYDTPWGRNEFAVVLRRRL
jgi:hypothetical protein